MNYIQKYALYKKYNVCMRENFKNKIRDFMNELDKIVYPEEKLQNKDILEVKVIQKVTLNNSQKE